MIIIYANNERVMSVCVCVWNIVPLQRWIYIIIYILEEYNFVYFLFVKFRRKKVQLQQINCRQT